MTEKNAEFIYSLDRVNNISHVATMSNSLLRIANQYAHDDKNVSNRPIFSRKFKNYTLIGEELEFD